MSDPFLLIEVFSEDGQTLIAELPRRFDVQGQEPLNVPGVGQVSIMLDDEIMARHPGIMNMRNVVKFWLGRGDGSGDHVHGFRIRSRVKQFITTEEFTGYIRTVSGPTLHADLSAAIIKHESPPRQDSSDTRSFSWTAPAESEWYVASDWDDSYNSKRWDDPSWTSRQGKPKGWPAKTAYWLWGKAPDGISNWHFWRRKHTWDDSQLVRLYVSADESVWAFIDGDMVIIKEAMERGFRSMGKYTLRINPGEHIFAFFSRVKYSSNVSADGVDAFIYCCTEVKDNGDPGDVIFKSDPDNTKHHAGLPPPGWRKASMFLKAVTEAKARDVRWIDNMTIGFTKDNSSENQAWTDRLNRGFKVGTTLLDMQAQLSELGGFDVWVDPRGYQKPRLECYKQRGADKSASKTLSPGNNLLEWHQEENDDIINSLLVKYEGGWLNQVENAGSVAANGRREAGVELQQAQDDVTAETIAAAHIDTRKEARKKAKRQFMNLTWEDPGFGSLTWSVGHVPMLDFITGDWVSAPADEGGFSKYRILSLTINEDNETGELSWEPELSEEVG